MFGVTDPIPRAGVVYKFFCVRAVSDACYVGETTRNVLTLVHDHMFIDRDSRIFNLQNSQHCNAALHALMTLSVS